MVKEIGILNGDAPILKDKQEKNMIDIEFLDGVNKKVSGMLPLSGLKK